MPAKIQRLGHPPIARMLYNPPNFLVLDEPTNHLDLATKEMLVDALKDFEGGLARPFASPINFRGALPLSRFLRQGGGLDFLGR